MEKQLSENNILLIVNYLESKTGIKIGERDRAKLLEAISVRVKTLKIKTLENYLKYFTEDRHFAEKELCELTNRIVNTESYFFRDQPQFDLIQKVVIPSLLQRNQPTKKLRLWSAGCASGEEAYSLAITLIESIPDWESWDIIVYGTDISSRAIEKAKTGEYTQYSFRGVDEEVINNYFNKNKDQLTVSPKLKQIVKFDELNLISDFPKKSAFNDIDLILCRNLFIYLNQAAVKEIVRKFTQSLREEGFFISGHGELIGIEHSLSSTLYPESMLFQKK